MQIESTSFVREKLYVGSQYFNGSKLIDDHTGKKLKICFPIKQWQEVTGR